MKYRFITICLLSFISIQTIAQNLQTIKPHIGATISYSKAEQKEWEKAIDWLQKSNDINELTPELEKGSRVYELVDQIEMGEGPMTQGPGCSWYCGGGPYKVTASSELNSINYKADYVHDFNLYTGGWKVTKALA